MATSTSATGSALINYLEGQASTFLCPNDRPPRLSDVSYGINNRANRLGSSDSDHILIAEYYNPAPVEVSYRGNSGKLFKRDFAGEMLDRYADLHLLDYGFGYHRDPQFPVDDITWFLLEKRP